MSAPAPPTTAGLSVRRSQPGDAPAIVAALQRAEGMTYFSAWMYDAAEVAAALTAGRLVSWIAVGPDGTVAAHGALEFPNGTERGDLSERRIVEYGAVFTAPEHRGQGLTGQVGAAALAWAQRNGIDEIWLWTTTLRPYVQRVAARVGADEMCLLLAMMPPGVNRGHDNDVPEALAAMLFVLRLRAAFEHGTWFIPPAHRELVAELVAGSAVQLQWPPPPPATVTGGRAGSGITSTYMSALRFAVVSIEEPSEHTVAATVREVFAFAARGANVTYVDLDPTRAEHMALVGPFEACGFSFAGIHPDYPRGRLRFRLQVLTCPRQDRDSLAVASPRGQRLLDHVWSQLPAPREGTAH